jgi:hypothetical protein
VLEILQHGTRVYARGGWRFYPGRCESGEVPIGTDVTGDGMPDLVVFEWSGAAHGGGVLRIFTLGPAFGPVVEFGAPARTTFSDIDGDGTPEILRPDDSFSFWPRSRAGSPRPLVVFRFRDGDYSPSPALMKTGPAAFADWPERALAIRGDRRWDGEGSWKDAHPDLWCYPIDLWYAGHADLANEFLRIAWPAHVAGKEEFVAELRRQIESSPYWPVVAGLNGRRAAPPEPPDTEGEPTSR